MPTFSTTFGFSIISAALIGLLGFVVWYLVASSKWRKVRAHLPGPPSYPLVGAGLSFLTLKNEDLLKIAASFVKDYGWRISVPLGPDFYVGLLDAEGNEKLLNSSTHISKGDVYKLFNDWLGTGLLTSTGKKWQHRRKLLTPAFHFKILDDFMKVFNQQSKVFVQTLRTNFRAGEVRDIFPYIGRLALDVICETAMGVKLNAQTDQDNPYVRAVYSMCEATSFRFCRPWYHPNFIWYLTQRGRREAKSLETILEFTKSVIEKRKEERKTKVNNQQEQVGSKKGDVDDVYFLGQRKRLAFLDMLLDAQENPENMLTNEDIREEVDTFMFEGHDTTAASIGWTIYLLACNQHHQDKVRDELREIFRDGDEREMTQDDLSKMKYMEMCIKESLRLYPSVPSIARKLTVDFDIGDTVIPKGANIFTMPYICHRDPKHFPDPETFDPLRFTPENSASRHPYAYIPFSAGPRNCIGQKFALMEEKTVLANFFRNFQVQAAYDIKDVTVMAEVIIRPKDGFPVTLSPL